MNKSIYLQIFVLAIMVAFMGKFNAYAQDVSSGKIPQIYTDKQQDRMPLRHNADAQNNYIDMLATQGFTFGGQTGNTETIQLPSGVIGTLLPWTTGTAYASGMTSNGTLYYIIDVGDSVWIFNAGTGAVTIAGVLTSPVGANGIAYNPANSQYYLCTGTDLYTLNVGTLTPTLVGSFVNSTLMIDLCFDYAGNCYGYDVATDMAYTINTTTGLATALGSLGYNANFGQGMGYDFETGWIYLTAFDGTAFDGQLRVMDPVTGYTNVLASFGLNQKDPFVPQSTPAALPGPGRATAPTPVNGGLNITGVPSVTLSWTNPGGATTTEVFFGTDPQALASIQSGGLATSISVTVDYSTNYYWYVNEISGGTTKGTLWSFTTEALACGVFDLPVTEDFETSPTLFPPLCWSTTGVLWDWFDNGAPNNVSALANFWSFASGTADLISMEYNSTGAPNPMLTFDWAYATCFDSPDELDIYYSTDAGTSWTILQAMPGGTNGILNTFNIDYCGGFYFPLANEWSTMSLPLPAGTNMVKFTAISAYGNLLWLDNVRITSELFIDYFENPPYAYPGFVAAQNPTNWTTWSGPPYTNEDATISTNYAFDGSEQSALIDYVPPRDVDLVYLTGTRTSGKWYMSFAAYIPAGKAGYFNAQATFTVDWGVEIYFDAGGTGRVVLDTNVPFTWQEGNWNQVMLAVDLDTGTAEFWFGPNAMTQIASWDWTRGGTVPNTLDGYDFFGATLNDEMYIDNFRFSDLAPPIIQPAADVGTFSIDLPTQVAPGTVVPLATVKNYGTDPQSFTVQMTINPGGYSDIQSVTALAPDATQQVTFINWTAVTGGPYVVDVTTILGGDEDPTNDNKAQSLMVWDPDGTWSTGANYPQNVYLGSAVGYSNGAVNKLYSIGGITASGLETECYEYDVPTDTWTALASLPAGRDRHATAIVGDFVYQIGGYDLPDVIQSTAYKYDIGLGTWTAIASLPVASGWNKAVGYGTNYIYHAGGYDGTNILADVYVYDVTANTWTAATPMPGPRFGGAFSVVGNQLIYVGGASDGPISDAVFVGTITGPGVITWTVADNPFPGTGKQSFDRINSDLTAPMTSESMLVNGRLIEAVPYPAGGMYRFDGAPWGADAMIVAGGSPTSTWVAANPNPCYIYEPATDTWTAKENVLAPVTAASTGSVYDGSTWKLILTGGINEAGVLGDTTSIFTQTLGGSTFAFSISVLNGWNMVSVPGLHPVNQNVATWWSGLTGQVFEFNGAYSPVTTTTPSVGYWMKNTGPQTYNYAGIQIVTHNSINAAAGWNLIGGYETTVPTASLTTTPPNLINTPVYEYNGAYTNAANLVPGYGYWVKMDQAGLINAPPLAKGSVEAVEYFKEGWGKIILTDATGTSYTLYAVTGQVDLNKYELPPAPPSGVMDIRYGSGRIAEDLTSSQSIELNSVQYPVSVRVENMTLTLQDPSGVAVNASINPGETVRISDNTINKLIVLSDGMGLPIEYALEQNYPNPFNPSTTIKFALPEAADVTLNIYNTLGEKIAQIVNSKLEAGRYSYQWDAGNIATGMYIYELRTDKFVSVKKMILLK